MMADYGASARSNYFRVNNLEAFKIRMDELDCRVVERKDGKVCIIAQTPSGSWPNQELLECDGEEEEREVDIIYEVRGFIADGEVCVLMETGQEKLCYLIGESIAFQKEGSIFVNLCDIYALAAEKFGVDETAIERCEY